MRHDLRNDIEAVWWYSRRSSLTGQDNSRRHQGQRGRQCDRFLCWSDLLNGESQHGGNHDKVKEAGSWSTRGERAPVGSGDILAETEWELRLKRLTLPDERARMRVRFPLPTLFRPVRSASSPHIAQPNSKPGRELDATLLHLYGINREDADYILETFPIVKWKDVEVHVTYRTKDTTLKIYDALAEAQRTDKPYQALLDLPPADLSAAIHRKRRRCPFRFRTNTKPETGIDESYG